MQFPLSATDPCRKHYEESARTFEHPDIGMAKCYDVVSGDFRLKDVAWYFPDPKPGYEQLKDHVTFRKFSSVLFCLEPGTAAVEFLGRNLTVIDYD
jgi:uncharacterized protein (DUF427 family)